MQSADITPGRRYGLRTARSEAIQRVKVLEKVRPGRWKVEFLDEPHPGLVDYVRSQHLVCPWAERKKLLRDEARMDRLQEVSDRHWPGLGPYDTAVMYVLEATGEGIGTQRGLLSSSPDTVARLWARVGEEAPSGRGCFTDRTGEMHVGWADVDSLARAFARAESKVVIDLVEMQEAKLGAGGVEPGEKWQLDYRRELGPAFALVRQWAGIEDHRAAQEMELDRLRQLVWRAIWDLRRLGHDAEAARLERALHGS